MPSIGTLGGTLPWGPKKLKVKCQAFPHDGSTGLKRTTPASLSVTDNHHRLEPRVKLNVVAVKVPGHDSWIHYSRVKPWKKTEEDTQYTCEPLGDLRYLFRTTSTVARRATLYQLTDGG
ncbi:unnamed protein product [Rangifer tarandus platyrhynchus]|uniref:Uncharacterized protein n=1 Tax=Rangifer tarandus platyrhynchus TaxID=3082113 RepID=A0ABN8ZXI3_RANTA|nr:unnamed protein product [Rangifer tarandus platyrhynchus]